MSKARVREADRSQLRWDMVDLDSQLPPDHRARIVWAFVERLNLEDLYTLILAREGVAGRPPADPAVLLAVWLYATLEGVGSARQIDRLCRSDAAYRWLCGGVSMNYHGLSDFRIGYADLLDRLLTETVTALVSDGLVSLDEVAIDGTKVKASAGRGSFKRMGTVEWVAKEARARVEHLKAEVQSDPAASERRRQAAQRRAAEDVERRAEAASRALEKMRAETAAQEKRHKKHAEKKKGEERASLTDSEARLMRFADGAIRAGYNVQLAVTPGNAIIVGASVTDRRNDTGLAAPMVEQIERRFKARPKRVLVDTKYATQDDIVALAKKDVATYTPAAEDKAEIKPENLRKRELQRLREPEALKAWRARMASLEGQKTYGRRKWVETVNGILKGRSMGILQVRSIAKAQCVALMHAIAHNIWRAHCLRTANA
jgi:transposase